MGPIVRIFAALVVMSVCQIAPARAAGKDGVSARPSHGGPTIRLGQACGDENSRRQEEERRVRRRRRDSREKHEMLERERARRRSKDRSIRLEQETRELLERQRREREARTRRIQKGFETQEERRRRGRRGRRLNADRSALLKRFPPAWVVGIIEGRVEIGWSTEAVIESWGWPQKIIPTAEGGEIWRYAAGRLIFSDGKVSAVALAQPAPPPSGGR